MKKIDSLSDTGHKVLAATLGCSLASLAWTLNEKFEPEVQQQLCSEIDTMLEKVSNWQTRPVLAKASEIVAAKPVKKKPKKEPEKGPEKEPSESDTE